MCYNHSCSPINAYDIWSSIIEIWSLINWQHLSISLWISINRIIDHKSNYGFHYRIMENYIRIMEIQNQPPGSTNDLWGIVILLETWSSINGFMKLHSRLLHPHCKSVTLVRIDIRKMFHSLQLDAKLINFALNMIVGIFYTWLTKLTNDRNNWQESS